MKREINIFTTVLSILTGILNFFFLGLAVALTTKDSEITANELITHIYIWASFSHAIISSWLYFYLKIAGRILAIVTATLGMVGPIIILTSGGGFSILWLSISICFGLIILIHIKYLIFTKNTNS